MRKIAQFVVMPPAENKSAVMFALSTDGHIFSSFGELGLWASWQVEPFDELPQGDLAAEYEKARS